MHVTYMFVPLNVITSAHNLTKSEKDTGIMHSPPVQSGQHLLLAKQ